MKYTPTPRQLALFSDHYRYIIDACSIISQNPKSLYPRSVHKGLWEEIDALVESREIVTCGQIANEVCSGKSDDIANRWVIDKGLYVLEEDEAVQRRVTEVVNATPKLLRFGTIRKSSSGDAFIIATALDYGLTIITEENKRSPFKIPQVAEQFGVESLSISELAEREGWSFERASPKG